MTKWQNRTSCVSLITTFYIPYFLPQNSHFLFPEKISSKITLHLNIGWWIFTYVGYEIHKIPCKFYSASYEAHKTGHTIVQCILWSTQDRIYNSAGDQWIINCCLYSWHILAHVISSEQNSTANPVSLMTLQYKLIAYATAD